MASQSPNEPTGPQAPYQGPPGPATAAKNGLGTAALVLGILALIGSFIPGLGIASIPMGLLGVILAILGLSRIKKGLANNRGASIAGLILSALAVVVAIIVTAISAAFLDAVNETVEDSGTSEVTPEAPSDEPTEGASEEASDQSSETESAPADEAEQFPGQTADDVVVEAGQPVNVAGATVTSAPLEEESDDTGSEYLCTVVDYVNDSDEQLSYNSFDWQLQNPQGNIVMSAFTIRDDQLESGELAPGGEVSGEVCFDATGDSGQHVVLTQPFISLSNDRGAWLNEL
ncbi:DUF4190 domain-containing protein [Auraticoccus monumenti]|uniref:DUF4352 domain-containing protein n=1 Tax=Auraticoccus monumenti TaxID=675864 RepID=A0A1G6TVA9_9ACTN|nr:DUF4190 domain-containing protein [Auraticoccus monumenti]SDD32971.1 protein of unknown function [Auraticoccus monumenti]